MENNLKILYLSFEHPKSSIGIDKKELNFCKAMYFACKELNIDFKGVRIFTKEDVKINFITDDLPYYKVKYVESNYYKFFSNLVFIRRFFRIKPIFQTAYKEIKEFNPNFIYFRYNLYLPGVFNPKKIKPNILVISEHQSKELSELLINHEYPLIPFELYNSKKFFKNIDAVVGVTSEIAQYETKRAKRNIPYLVFPNGVEVGNYKIKKYLNFNNDELNILFVSASTYRWQGIERLLVGIKNYKGNTKLTLHIVGSLSNKILRLINSLKIEKNVLLHGIKHTEEINDIFDNSHVAIGPLGLHRINLTQGANLKVREYMSRGIPFVIGHIDEDIEENFPFVLKIPSNDSPVVIEDLIDFLKRIDEKYGSKTPHFMRDYALKKMDYKVKVKRLIDFILNLKKD